MKALVFVFAMLVATIASAATNIYPTYEAARKACHKTDRISAYYRIDWSAGRTYMEGWVCIKERRRGGNGRH